MLNTTVLATRKDFNPFTLALKARCEAEGEVSVRMRNGDYCKVVYRPANPIQDQAFHKSDHSAYWEPNGQSVTGSDFDIVEFDAAEGGAGIVESGSVGAKHHVMTVGDLLTVDISPVASVVRPPLESASPDCAGYSRSLSGADVQIQVPRRRWSAAAIVAGIAAGASIMATEIWPSASPIFDAFPIWLRAAGMVAAPILIGGGLAVLMPVRKRSR
jgi:hypothetical protein